MVLIDSIKYACATCIKGHRSSTCNHDTRPLIEIKKKGRPVTQCVHCRELRKTKQVHVKCLCEGRPEASGSAPRTVVLPAAASKTAVVASAAPSEKTCDCHNGGECNCATPKHPPRRSASAKNDEPGAKPAITRGHTFHASTMSHDAPISIPVHPKLGGNLQRAASLQHNPGSTTGGASGPTSSNNNSNNCSSGSHHPSHQHFNHAAHLYAPYHHTLHQHHAHPHAHAHFDLPDVGLEEETDEVKPISPNTAYRRLRSTSASYGDLARPFPPPHSSSSPGAPNTSFYGNSAGAISLPDVLAWAPSSSDAYNSSPASDLYDARDALLYTTQNGGGDASQRASSFPPSTSGVSGVSDFDTFIPDDIFGSSAASQSNFTSGANAGSSGPAAVSYDYGFGQHRSAAESVHDLDLFDAVTIASTGLDVDNPLRDATDRAYVDLTSSIVGGVGADGELDGTDYEAMLASILAQDPANLSVAPPITRAGSSGTPGSVGTGTGPGSSRPPSMTSRSSSRASGTRPTTGFDCAFDMTPAAMASASASAHCCTSSAPSGPTAAVCGMAAEATARGRPLRGNSSGSNHSNGTSTEYQPATFPVADPFESADASTAIPPFDYPIPRTSHSPPHLPQRQNSSSANGQTQYQPPAGPPPSKLQLQHHLLRDIDNMSMSSIKSQSMSPMSQDSRDDGNGTQFPAWPGSSSSQSQSQGPNQTQSPIAFDGFDSFATPSSVAGLYGSAAVNGMAMGMNGVGIGAAAGVLQKRRSIEFDDSAWNVRA